MVRPGEAVFVDIDDIKKPSAEIFTKDKSGKFKSAGRLSSGGIRRSSSSRKRRQAEAKRKEEALRKKQEAAAKIKAAELKKRIEAKKRTDALKKKAESKKRKTLEMNKRKTRTRREVQTRKTKTSQIQRGDVQPVQKPKGFIKNKIKELRDLQKKRSTSSIRKKQTEIRNELELLGLTIGTSIIGGVQGIIALPGTIKEVIKNPSRLKQVPANLRRSGQEFGQLIRISPTEALGKIAGEVVLLKGTGKTLEVTGTFTKTQATKLSPTFRKVKEGKINVKTSQGKTELELGIIGKGTSLKEQVKLAGKKPKAAVSSQADALLNVIKNRQKSVRKPIPGEETFTKTTKNLLEKFDNGKITKKQLVDLDKRVLKESGKTLLERSVFLDPKGKVRFTRLGQKQPKASLVDILSGDFTTKSPKPQILVFPNEVIQKLPKSLSGIGKKLKSGKKLTAKERSKLVQFQVKKSGKLKPIGDVEFKGGKELEVTIAPGELIKRKKSLGTTIIDGKRVQIVEAEIFKTSKALKNKIKKAKDGKLTKKEVTKLEKEITKKTGFKSSLTKRRRSVGRPKARKPRRAPRVTKRVNRRAVSRKAPSRTRKNTRKSIPRKTPPRTPGKRPPRRTTKRPPAKRPPRRIIGRPPKSPPRLVKVPKTPTRIRGKTRKRKVTKKPKKKPSYNVYARPLKKTKKGKRSKLVKVNKVPLTKARAKDVRNYVTDTSLSRTARIRPTKGKPRKSKLRVPAGYSKRTSRKFRTHRIVKGKRKKLPKGKVIEKRTRLLDTRQEKKKITLKKRIKQIRIPKKKRKKR